MSARIASWVAVTNEESFPLPPPLSKAMRRTDAFSRYAVMAAVAAQGRLPQCALAPHLTGIFLATCYGPMETGFRFLDGVEEGEPSPIRFTQSVHNVASGYIAMALQLTGPVVTLTTFHWPLVVALDQALQDLASGRVQRALVLAVEMDTPLLEASRMRQWDNVLSTGDQRPPGQAIPPHAGGAVAWILEGSAAPGPRLREITQISKSCDVNDLLLRTGESWSGPALPPKAEGVPRGSAYPLDHALALTHGLDAWHGSGEAVQWRLLAPFGEACLHLDSSEIR